MGDLNIKEDYERIYKLMSKDRLAMAMFNGFETVVTRNVEKLKKYDFDMLICIPVKYEADIHNIFINLSKIDIPLKTAVILGCEKDSSDMWLKELNRRIAEVSSRFVFCEVVFATRARDIENNNQELQYLIRVIREIEKKVGMINPSLVFYIKVTREEIRIIAKHLSCKYLFWFDADIVLPQDIVKRLLRYVNISDVISAWTINRHFLYKKTDSFTKRPYKVKSELDREYYQKNKDMMTRFLAELEKARISNQDLIFSLIDKSGGYSIPPWYLESETEPIEVLWSGFSCVLCTKDVNDKASFVNSYAHAEDYDFCTHARKLGFKVVVDPTCKCEHLGAESMDGSIPTRI